MVAILEFLENSIIAQNQLALIRNIKNVSNIFKLNIWLEKLEIKMYFKKIQVKIVKWLLKKWLAMARIVRVWSTHHYLPQ